MPSPIFAPWLSPESLAGGLSGSEVDEAVADATTAEGSLDDAADEALLALDVGVEVGHAVDGPYSTMR